VYPSIRFQRPAAERTATIPQQRRANRFSVVSGNVVALGFTSLFTDISSEMVNSVLPLYLAFQLGFTPFQLGGFDGAYQAVAVLTAFFGAVAADRSNRHKEIAGAGYGLSAICKIGLLGAGSSPFLTTAVLYTDRVGKGFRTAPRDALISLSSKPEHLGVSFGLHRALDTVGALIGPLLAFALLELTPNAYNSIFVVSFAFAVIGVSILSLFAKNRRITRPDRPRAPLRASLTQVLDLARERPFLKLAIAGLGLGLFTVSDALIYLTFQHKSSMSFHFFPLLSVGTAAAYLVLAVPVGHLADRVGRRRVFLTGFLFLLGSYALLFTANPGPLVMVTLLASLGTYYAFTDGVLAAIGSSVLQPEKRTTGLAALNGAVILGRATSSLLFGWMWGRYGTTSAVLLSLVGLAVMVTFALALVPRETPCSNSQRQAMAPS